MRYVILILFLCLASIQGILAREGSPKVHHVLASSLDEVQKAEIIAQGVLFDFRWRYEWVNRLREFEDLYATYLKSAQLYYFVYKPKPMDVKADHSTERTSVGFDVFIMPDIELFKSLNAKYFALKEGLENTRRASAWGLDNWPSVSITGISFVMSESIDIKMIGVLINSDSCVIATQDIVVPLRVKSDLPSGVLAPALQPVFSLVFPSVEAGQITDKLKLSFRRNSGVLNILPV